MRGAHTFQLSSQPITFEVSIEYFNDSEKDLRTCIRAHFKDVNGMEVLKSHPNIIILRVKGCLFHPTIINKDVARDRVREELRDALEEIRS